jgi:hypothetical protein
MLILVTLGAFSIASSNANYRLSQRALNWNRAFFALDGQGEFYLSHIDGALADAEQMAINAVMDRSLVPAELQDIATPDISQLDLFNYVYIYYANEFVSQLFFFDIELIVYPFGIVPYLDGLWIQYTVASEMPDFEGCFLYISMWVDPAIDLTIQDGIISVEYFGGLRYNISDWYEYQEIEMPPASVQLWDGTF